MTSISGNLKIKSVNEFKVSYNVTELFQPYSNNFFLLFGPREVLGTRVISFFGFYHVVYSPLSVKSCSHLKELRPEADSGTYLIDPDGKGNLTAFNVTCNMTDKNGVGVTVISHSSENRTLVNGYNPPGSYSSDIHYTGASLSQLASLTEVSSHCEQFIKYECFHSALLSLGEPKRIIGWWVSRNSTKMTYWGGAEPDSHKCACGMNKSCADRKNLKCNCDRNDATWREDSGFLTDKSTLPVAQLRFGDTGSVRNNTVDERGYHTLGKFKCYGINRNESLQSDNTMKN